GKEVTAESIDPTPVDPGVTDPDCEGDCTITILNIKPSIGLAKSDNGAEVKAAGDVIVYTLTVTNTGNVSLDNVTITDPLTGLEENIGTLAAGATVSIDTEYEVTQVDVENGNVLNKAIVTGEGPEGETAGDEDEIETSIERLPNISLTKEVDLESVSREGVVLTYTLTVTNTGNVTLSSGELTDPKTGMIVPGITLAPGEFKTFITTYTVTLEDLLSGEPILNIAQIKAIDPISGQFVEAQDQATVNVNLEPSISIKKTADVSEVTLTGDVITYTLVVTNTGTAPLVNVVVSDPLTGFEETIVLLLPGGTREIITTYTVAADDFLEDDLVNTATVKGELPGGDSIENSDSATVELNPEIIANDDDYGIHTVSFGGVLGNILDNDLYLGQRPDPADVDFEFVDLGGLQGLLIDEEGNISLIPGLNPVGEYLLQYILRDKDNPDLFDYAYVTIELVYDDVNLKITKNALSEEVFEGDEFEYEITVSNIGGYVAHDVIVTDDLPNGVTYLSNRVESNSHDVGIVTSFDGSRIVWTVPTFPADATITFRIRVKAGAAGSVTNVAFVGSEENDFDETDNQDSDVTEIQPFHIPNVITPNNDRVNDTFEIQGLEKYERNEIVIFNRYGDHLLEEENYKNDWDAPGQVAGTYFYVLKVWDSNNQEHVFKGWIKVVKGVVLD
ncbi:DUF7507 domain-containing protein, partial [Algoriphagus zhangzhouensis]